jgi:hypothetical protein
VAEPAVAQGDGLALPTHKNQVRVWGFWGDSLLLTIEVVGGGGGWLGDGMRDSCDGGGAVAAAGGARGSSSKSVATYPSH